MNSYEFHTFFYLIQVLNYSMKGIHVQLQTLTEHLIQLNNPNIHRPSSTFQSYTLTFQKLSLEGLKIVEIIFNELPLSVLEERVKKAYEQWLDQMRLFVKNKPQMPDISDNQFGETSQKGFYNYDEVSYFLANKKMEVVEPNWKARGSIYRYLQEVEEKESGSGDAVSSAIKLKGRSSQLLSKLIGQNLKIKEKNQEKSAQRESTQSTQQKQNKIITADATCQSDLTEETLMSMLQSLVKTDNEKEQKQSVSLEKLIKNFLSLHYNQKEGFIKQEKLQNNSNSSKKKKKKKNQMPSKMQEIAQQSLQEIYNQKSTEINEQNVQESHEKKEKDKDQQQPRKIQNQSKSNFPSIYKSIKSSDKLKPSQAPIRKKVFSVKEPNKILQPFKKPTPTSLHQSSSIAQVDKNKGTSQNKIVKGRENVNEPKKNQKEKENVNEPKKNQKEREREREREKEKENVNEQKKNQKEREREKEKEKEKEKFKENVNQKVKDKINQKDNENSKKNGKEKINESSSSKEKANENNKENTKDQTKINSQIFNHNAEDPIENRLSEAKTYEKANKSHGSHGLLKSKSSKKDITSFPTIARHPIFPSPDYPPLDLQSIDPFQQQFLLTEMTALSKDNPAHPKILEIFALVQSRHEKCCGQNCGHLVKFRQFVKKAKQFRQKGRKEVILKKKNINGDKMNINGDKMNINGDKMNERKQDPQHQH